MAVMHIATVRGGNGKPQLCGDAHLQASSLFFPAFSASHGVSLLGEGPLERPGARLCLHDGPLRTAAKCRYGKRPELEKTAHLLIAGDCSLVNPPGAEWGVWCSPSAGPSFATLVVLGSCRSLRDVVFGAASGLSPSQCLFL